MLSVSDRPLSVASWGLPMGVHIFRNGDEATRCGDVGAVWRRAVEISEAFR